MKERRTFNYPELKFFIGQVGLINQDRLLSQVVQNKQRSVPLSA